MSVGSGRTAVRLTASAQGRDLLVAVTGGEAHVGAVAVAGPGGEPLGQVVVPGHKEGPLAVRCAAELAAAAGCVCTVVAGIHQDEATKDEIATIVANVAQGCDRLAADLRDAHRDAGDTG